MCMYTGLTLLHIIVYVFITSGPYSLQLHCPLIIEGDKITVSFCRFYLNFVTEEVDNPER